MDNAVAEAFNSTLEFELLSQSHFATRQETRRAVARWIDHYNLERRHSTTRIDGQMMSPIAYEQARAHTHRQTNQQEADQDAA
ncbi:MAG: putative transposase [Actinomycetia bacterium]|nr:putative transposase [Actinomycetes bacterium]